MYHRTDHHAWKGVRRCYRCDCILTQHHIKNGATTHCNHCRALVRLNKMAAMAGLE